MAEVHNVHMYYQYCEGAVIRVSIYDLSLQGKDLTQPNERSCCSVAMELLCHYNSTSCNKQEYHTSYKHTTVLLFLCMWCIDIR